MAVRFSADGQDYTRTLSLGAQTQFSFALWVKISVDRDAFSTAFSLDLSTANNCTLQTDSTGTKMDLRAGGVQASHILTVGTWAYFGVSINGINGTMVSRDATASAFTVATWNAGGLSSFTLTNLRLGESVWGTEWLNGCVAAAKVWVGATLSQQELENECWHYLPRRTSNLIAWYPMLTASTTDYSGNGATLSGGSGTATEDGPPISWRTGRHRTVLPPSNITGTVEATLPALTGSLDGQVKVAGQLDGSLSAIGGTFDATATVEGPIDARLPALTGGLTGDVTSPGLLNGVLPAVTGSFQGELRGGFLNGTLPAVGGGFAGHLQISGSLDATLPALTSSLTGKVKIPANDITIETPGPIRRWAAGTPSSGWAAGDTARAWAARPPST